MKNQQAEREKMVETQIAARGVRDPAALAAMRSVPREVFVPPELAEFAYQDTPLPIESGQTISQPYIVALMAAALELGPGDRVLEIGTGSGYAAAVLSRMAREVYTVERHEELARIASRRLRDLGFDNVSVLHGDGTLGCSEHAPYDAIVVAAGGPKVPPSLLDQLAVGGGSSSPSGRRKPRRSFESRVAWTASSRRKTWAPSASSPSSAPKAGRSRNGRHRRGRRAARPRWPA